MKNEKVGRISYSVLAWILTACLLKIERDHPQISGLASDIVGNILAFVAGWVLTGPKVLPGMKSMCMAIYVSMMVMFLAGCDHAATKGLTISGKTQDGLPFCYGPNCPVPGLHSADPTAAGTPTRAP